MGNAAKIEVEPKNTSLKMCSQRKIIADKCEECFSEIQEKVHESANQMMAEIKEKVFEELSEFFKSADEKIDANLKSSKEKTDQLSANSKWILSIVLGVTFCVGAGFGVLWGKVYDKADKDEVLTINEAKALHEIRDAYYKSIFVYNPQAKVDSTNYNFLIKSIFGGTLRGESHN